jgi:peptide/nickel transport system substrate-binding protein
MEPTRWRFYLRKGVKFHDGTPFTADDVVFSAERVRHPDSDLRVRLSADTQVIKVDDHTVDFVTEAPNPILPNEWSIWYIMYKSWTEKNNAVTPQSATKKRGKLCHPPCQRHRAFYIGQSGTGCKNRLQSQSGLVG